MKGNIFKTSNTNAEQKLFQEQRFLLEKLFRIKTEEEFFLGPEHTLEMFGVIVDLMIQAYSQLNTLK